MKIIARIPWWLLIVSTVLLAIAPYPREPQPHLVQKIQMLLAGSLSRPIDIIDLFQHGGLFPLLIGLKLLYRRRHADKDH